MTRTVFAVAVALVLTFTVRAAEPAFRAGAAAVDVTPERFPVVVNCGFAEATGTVARDRLHARALVLDDGTTKLAIVVVDNCMMPREFLDAVKELVAAETKIPADRQLIAATHTHTAPAVMGCLGADPDPAYGPFLERQIVQAVRRANANLVPARAGWAVTDASALTNNRQWILRSDKVRADPFGNLTVRSNMHPGYENPDFVGPSGPTDPWLSALSVRTADGKPLAVLSNFSMHYFGTPAVSADYFGKVCANVEKRLGGDAKGFVALHSQGTAGDLHWMDYGKPAANPGIDKYAESVTAKIVEALDKIQYRSDLPIAMAEIRLTLGRCVPDAVRLAWAQKLVGEHKGTKPTKQADIYAREAVMLAADPRRELKLQAIRIGELGIAAIPNEVFAITGLKIKSQSPLRTTFAVELANGSEGYIPPAEQHPLGGYTTWPARTAALEVGAEAKIAEAAIGLLEKVAGKKRAPLPDPHVGAYPEQLAMATRYWRLGELAGPTIRDRSGTMATAESGVVFGLDGPLPRFSGGAAVNRSAHFAGGRIIAKLPEVGNSYTVETWFWNGFPANAREWTGTLFTLAAGSEAVDSLSLGGTKGTANALTNGASSGKTAAAFRSWNHAALVRDGDRVRVYLNGKLEAESHRPRTAKPDSLVIGGRPDKQFGWEGRLAEVAVHTRALAETELAGRVKLVKSLDASHK
jgi:Concanavalin A-like lectin/glucanases superfamily